MIQYVIRNYEYPRLTFVKLCSLVTCGNAIDINFTGFATKVMKQSWCWFMVILCKCLCLPVRVLINVKPKNNGQPKTKLRKFATALQAHIFNSN
jgi:hypothetical protein